MSTVAPDHILKELEELWVTTGKQGEGEAGQGVLRACTLTLVAIAEESDDPMALGETVAALMPEHPARTIIIRLRGVSERTLSERVYAQCWMPFGQRRQICCEQVEITASDAALDDLASVILPLEVPDLPVVLWCRSARLAGMPEFDGIAQMAQKVVVDTAPMADSRAALELVAGLVSRGILAGDLSWTRTTRWRETLAQIFENQSYLEGLARTAVVRVASSGEQLTVWSWYLAAWIMDALAAAGARPRLEITHSEHNGVTLEAEGWSVALERWGARLVTTINGLAQCTSLPAPTDYALMREELGILRRDAVFEATLSSAVKLVHAEDK
ncbi:MAG: glucose-6-phosphate dehydrogenase assembly protein OpcA [Bryobacteraceae bacterium]|jgi:glucose-6-phosphate dehydrogenase assembly protein OpcA